jgi:hypothetical protein
MFCRRIEQPNSCRSMNGPATKARYCSFMQFLMKSLRCGPMTFFDPRPEWVMNARSRHLEPSFRES